MILADISNILPWIQQLFVYTAFPRLLVLHCRPHMLALLQPGHTSPAVPCGGQAVRTAHTAVTALPVSRPMVCHPSLPLDITHTSWRAREPNKGGVSPPSCLLCVDKSQLYLVEAVTPVHTTVHHHLHLLGNFSISHSCCQCLSVFACRPPVHTATFE